VPGGDIQNIHAHASVALLRQQCGHVRAASAAQDKAKLLFMALLFCGWQRRTLVFDFSVLTSVVLLSGAQDKAKLDRARARERHTKCMFMQNQLHVYASVALLSWQGANVGVAGGLLLLHRTKQSLTGLVPGSWQQFVQQQRHTKSRQWKRWWAESPPSSETSKCCFQDVCM
jgi:hypothetical protein